MIYELAAMKVPAGWMIVGTGVTEELQGFYKSKEIAMEAIIKAKGE